MLVEQSFMLVNEGMEEDFDAMMAEKGIPLLRGLEGAKAVTLGRGLENPDKFILLLEWETMDAHIAFTKNPLFGEFLALLKPFTNGGSMEHFNMR